MVRNGDYVNDGAGGFLRAEGTDAERAGLARQYVAQALSDEAELSVAGVELSAGGELTVELDWRGEALRLILGTGGV